MPHPGSVENMREDDTAAHGRVPTTRRAGRFCAFAPFGDTFPAGNLGAQRCAFYLFRTGVPFGETTYQSWNSPWPFVWPGLLSGAP
jgi:hypothetical protein